METRGIEPLSRSRSDGDFSRYSRIELRPRRSRSGEIRCGRLRSDSADVPESVRPSSMGDTGGNGNERPFLRCPGISRGETLRYRVGGSECISECVCTYSGGGFSRGVPTALDLRPYGQRSVDALRPRPFVARVTHRNKRAGQAPVIARGGSVRYSVDPRVCE